MKIEFTKEPNFSNEKCIKFTAQNSTEELLLAEFFDENIDMGEIDCFTDNDKTTTGFKDLTLYKKK